MIHPETIESIREIISGVIARMGIQADIEVREQPDTIVYNIRTADSNMLIGQHGVNLSALLAIIRRWFFAQCPRTSEGWSTQR